MKTHNISLINGFVLIIIGLFGYFTSELRPITALIPVFFGTFIVLMNNGVKKENKFISHIVVVLTFMILIGLLKPLFSAIDRGDNPATFRVFLMVATTIIAMVYFIKSFIKARKAKRWTNMLNLLLLDQD